MDFQFYSIEDKMPAELLRVVKVEEFILAKAMAFAQRSLEHLSSLWICREVWDSAIVSFFISSHLQINFPSTLSLPPRLAFFRI